MKEEWWESPVCYLCDYWWTLLLGLALVLTAYFTREYWLPILGLHSEATEVPIATVLPATQVPTAVSQPATVTPTIGPTTAPTTIPESLAGYTNTASGYAFNYPTEWEGIETGTSDVQFLTPKRTVIYVHTEPRPAGELPAAFATYLQDGLPYEVLDSIETYIAGQPAPCQQVAKSGEQQITALTCYLVAEGQGYALSMVGLDGLSQVDQQSIQDQFMDMVASFTLIP